ncbi:hypothetical protein C8A00DRAFT_14997 [Chaetomidium leptoderma]|uniref:Uncharacterized protein n=1 Tax=Chaetomidium leptoderma TaxID=669021 RepID=A0AAN6VM07_9PEZI|nr:hypothetical protein C8A00DRAFT_14997 [Chaetomidium leptoderma]
MGRPADEDLPEVVPQQMHQTQQDLPYQMRQPSPLPEVVPDSSPEAAPQRFYMETDKYPALYDTAPKLPHDGYVPVQAPGQQYQQQWPGSPNPISSVSPNSSLPWQPFPPGADDQQTYVGSEPEQEKRICGIRKRLFFIIAAIVAGLIVAVGVGAGVGGAMAARQPSSDAAAAADASQTTSQSESNSRCVTTEITTTSGRSSTTTSTAPKTTITSLEEQTDPDTFKRFALQLWEKHDYKGRATDVLYEEGFYDLKFNATSYIWLPNNTDCCVTFCTSKTDDDPSWWCDIRKKNATDNDVGFQRISIWCGRWSNTKMQKICS